MKSERARPSADGHEGLKTLPTHGQSASKSNPMYLCVTTLTKYKLGVKCK